MNDPWKRAIQASNRLEALAWAFVVLVTLYGVKVFL